MKILKYIKYGLLTLLPLTFSNCSYLKYDETSFNREDDVFSDFGRTKNFLSGIYAYLPTDFNSIEGAMRSSATDESEYVSDLSDVQRFNQGRFSPLQPVDNVWGQMYSGIRAANLFLEKTKDQKYLEDQYNLNYSETIAQFKNYPYEARFLRAFFYFELAKRYNNVPLITKTLTPEEAKGVKQNTFNEIVNFIVSECDDIAISLPKTYVGFSSVSETGRATKGAALALKARTLLYAASFLHNPTKEKALWVKAAVAAKEVMDLTAYTLEPNYSNIPNNYKSKELILERRQGASNDFEKRNFPIGYEGGNTGNCPSQNLVDAYEMKSNGLPITDALSGYSPMNPYAGRDPRLEKTIIVNGSTWKSQIVKSYVGGANGKPKTNATKTGYYLKKHVVEIVNLLPTNTTTREHSWVLFRYGEILLDYAEAMNEAYGPEDASTLGKTALQAVNEIRFRAGMPNFPAGLTQAKFQEKLRNERMVELAFEDHRFWDVRRWKIGAQTSDIYQMEITPATSGPGFVYEKKILEVRPFEDRMNFYPIPQAEINKNPNLVQNTGW
ncbi:RagB/SusD family nutrient uptake outer membrane protein [Pedobacter arcticus]|uniref:RagB/SusD family nutrient uptake outer membrane protein n=1 Tax=Pedobacter arcticus TaxID=752140 RepID=UPI00031B612A|nr:RagB/SusD family nutrient uptake outer membrane protein [Pedobacter arcticus]